MTSNLTATCLILGTSRKNLYSEINYIFKICAAVLFSVRAYFTLGVWIFMWQRTRLLIRIANLHLATNLKAPKSSSKHFQVCIFEQIFCTYRSLNYCFKIKRDGKKPHNTFVISLFYIRSAHYLIQLARLLSVFTFHRLVYLRRDFFFIWTRNDITSKCLYISQVNATTKWPLMFMYLYK